MKKVFYAALVALFAVVSASLFAAGPDAWYIPRGAGKIPEINALNVKGDITLAGSSTVYPLAERLADMFTEEGYAGAIEISSIGSGAGFERWAKNGETDIATASRPIKQSEIDAAKKIGRDPIEFRVGTDALAVVVNAQNTWVKSATKQELAKIFTARKWNEVNPAWPNEAILKFSPGTDSGTFDYFVEEIFAGKKEPLLNAPGIQLSEDDNILSRGVQGNKYAVGYFGYAYYAEESKKLGVLSIDGVTPSKDSVNKGTYPLARPLFMYSSASIMQKKPQVAAFLGYVLNYSNVVSSDVGYFPADAAATKVAADKWIAAAKPLMQ